MAGRLYEKIHHAEYDDVLGVAISVKDWRIEMYPWDSVDEAGLIELRFRDSESFSLTPSELAPLAKLVGVIAQGDAVELAALLDAATREAEKMEKLRIEEENKFWAEQHEAYLRAKAACDTSDWAHFRTTDEIVDLLARDRESENARRLAGIEDTD